MCAMTKKMAQMKEEIKVTEKIQLSNKEIQPIKRRVQNTSNQDAHRIGLIRSQIKGKNEG